MEHQYLKIQHPGWMTSFQDAGRSGVAAMGVPEAGALDKVSFLLANWLVGNPLDNPCMEVTWVGPKIEFLKDTFIAITGAKTNVFINHLPVSINQVIKIKAGDVLNFGACERGVRNYISFAAKLDLPQQLDSFSPLEQAKGWLKKGDLFSASEIKTKINRKELPPRMVPFYSKNITLRITRGPEFYKYEDKFNTLTTTQYQVTPQTDRRGIRLNGEAIKTRYKKEIISSPTLKGTIQVPPNGQPIILMNDGPVTGGYNRIATIITADIHHLGQLRPGYSIRFHEVSFEAAIEMYDNFILKMESVVQS